MSTLNERYRRILEHPLDYLHPQRLELTAQLDTQAVRQALEPLLTQALELPRGALDLAWHNPWSTTWLRHWQRLPRVAALMGAYLQFGQLTRGAALTRLSVDERRFAACAFGQRAPLPASLNAPLAQRTRAQGLKVLLGWERKIPQALLQALPLQFSPAVAALAFQLPAQAEHPTLFAMALQHARFHSHMR